MYFQTIFGLATTLSLLSVTITVLADDCTNGPFGTGSSRIAGLKGSALNFCDSHWETGLVITGIEVWATKFQLKGIQFSWSDGTKTPVNGNTRGNKHESVSWDATEKITKLQVWDNSDKDAVGGIYLEVGNKKLDISGKTTKDDGSGDEIVLDSGFLIAALGNGGEMITNLQLKFLANPVDTMVITDMKFNDDLDAWNKQMKGVQDSSLAKLIIKNTNTDDGGSGNSTDGGSTKGYIFQNTITKTVDKTISHQTTNMFGASVGVKVSGGVEVPLLAEAKVEVSTEISYQYTKMEGDSTSETSTKTLSWSETGTLKPGRAVVCSASAYQGKFDGDYMSTVELTLKDGKKFQIKQPGNFKSSGWSSAQSNCKEVAVADVPSDGTEEKEADQSPDKVQQAAANAPKKAEVKLAGKPDAKSTKRMVAFKA